MVRKVIEWLFENESKPHATQEWYRKIRDNPKTYENCFVISFTRVKDLDSKWKHEYVQFVVEDESHEEDKDDSNRTRVYAERGNAKDLDWVTVGVNDKDTNKRRKDLPLPLTTLFFAKDHRPKLVDIASLLDKTTRDGGPYDLRGHNCFWFANVMYLAARGIEGITGWTEKQWNRIDIAGKGGGGMDDLFSLLGATLLKFLFRPTAKKFMEERARRTLISLDPTGPKGPELVTPKEYMDKIAATVLNPEVFSAYIEILKENGISMDENTLKSLLKEAGQQAERESEQEELDWNEEFYDDVKDLETKVFADSDAVKLLKLYNAAESQNAPASSGDKDSTGRDNDNQSKEQQRVEMSYRVFAGKILVEAGLQTLK